MNNFENEFADIQALFAREPEKTWQPREICAALELRGKQIKKLQGVLHRMAVDGLIVELRPGVFGLGKPADLITGKMRMIRSGAGLVVDNATGTTVWVGSEDLGTALPDDTVTVRLDPASSGQEPRGKVIRLVERSPRDIVGTLSTTGKFLFVVPLNPVYRLNFYVPDAKGAKDGDRVVLRLTDWKNRHVAPEGEILDVIGPADQPSLDTEVVMRQFDLPLEFPAAVLQEAEAVAARAQRPGARDDLRGEYIVTVDPERARDFDDAISLTHDAQGRRVLGVHIADVSHFVRPEGALDKEALARGTSVYLVDKVVPMLPEQLSNGECSLRPDVDRLTFSAFMTFDEKGRMIARRFAKTIIHSRQRLTYEQAMAIMTDRPPEGMETVPAMTKELLLQVRELARQLRQRRFADAALDLEVPECEVIIGPDGRMTGIRTVPHDESHQLIEECMVAANEAVATELESRGIRILARLHEAPDEDKLGELRANLAQLGVKSGDLCDPRRMAQFIAETANHPLAAHLHTMVLRSMKRAVYSAEASGHFGLAKKHYAHFTSPIRRYPDLVLHRQLAGFLLGEKGGNGFLPADYLKRTAAHCTAREQLADDASRALIEIKKFRLLQQQLDDQKPVVYDAVVSKVTNYGMFVDVQGVLVTGLVHISAISSNFVRHNSANDTLSVGNESFRVGTKLKVHVARVDFNQRRADFALVRGSATTRENAKLAERYSFGPQARKERPAGGKSGPRWPSRQSNGPAGGQQSGRGPKPQQRKGPQGQQGRKRR
jgi:ribonuclease R